MSIILSLDRIKTILAAVFFLSCLTVEAQKEFDGIRGTRHWMMFTDAPNSLYHHLADEAFEYLSKRSDEVGALQTLKQWQQRQQWIRKMLSKTVGQFPDKTPLRPKVTKVVREDGYSIENIVFESQPGYYVTSSLFIPENAKRKHPAIVYCSGHSDNGYRLYKNVIVNLAKKGFVVFAFDPMGQGERLQYYDAGKDGSRFPWPSYEHSYAGAQLFMTGNTLARYFIWDGIRAVDYLLTRKEVDPERIGITGRSGGGTQAAFIAAFDDRIKAVASENYFTDFKWLYQSMGPQDAEQNFFNGIEAGLDMADLLEVRAPKPALIIATSRDMFPVQGAMETRDEVSRLYKAYGHPENFDMVSDDAPHASTKKNREAMYAFFQKSLDNPGDPSDEKIKPLNKADLQVTESGQVATSLHAETAFSLNRKSARERMDQLDARRRNVPAYFNDVVISAKELSGYSEPTQTSSPVFTGRIQRPGYSIEKYFVKGEGDYVIPYLLMKPETQATRALIYLDPAGKSNGAGEGGEMEWFVKNGFMVLSPDLIGTGEMGPGEFRGDSYIDSVSYNLWFASMLVGRSIVGIQTGDLVRLVRLIRDEPHIKEIAALAKKQMAPVLLHAAAFEPGISRIALVEPYASYRSIVMTSDYDPHFVQSTVPGAVGVYDLPDLAGSLAPRSLMISGITDGAGNTSEDLDEDISVIKRAYANARAEGRLQICPLPVAGAFKDTFGKWFEDPPR